VNPLAVRSTITWRSPTSVISSDDIHAALFPQLINRLIQSQGAVIQRLLKFSFDGRGRDGERTSTFQQSAGGERRAALSRAPPSHAGPAKTLAHGKRGTCRNGNTAREGVGDASSAGQFINKEHSLSRLSLERWKSVLSAMQHGARSRRSTPHLRCGMDR